MAFPVLVAALALAVSLPAAAVTPARKPASAPTVPLADTSPSRLPAAGPLELLAVFEQQFGRHPGLRKGHARGFCASGEFQPAP